MKKLMIMGAMLASANLYVTSVHANTTLCVKPYLEHLLNNGKWDTASGYFLANNRVYTIEHNGATVTNNFNGVPTKNVKVLSSKWDPVTNSCGMQVQEADGTKSKLVLFPHPKTQK